MCKTSVGAEPLNRNFQQRGLHFQTLFLTYRPQVLPKPQLRTLTTFVRDVLTRLSPIAPTPTPHMLKNPIKNKNREMRKGSWKEREKKTVKAIPTHPYKFTHPPSSDFQPQQYQPISWALLFGTFSENPLFSPFPHFSFSSFSPPPLSPSNRERGQRKRERYKKEK